ncbi:MAG TPA: sensor histidine kinase [Casimicrobiaceae bacterium]|nr:sensor histidine kinase [Casimicrobiaceae bacterium]
MDRTRNAEQELAVLAAHLAQRQDAILLAWRKRVDADAELTAPSSLPRTQFNDHVPHLLDAFRRQLVSSAAGQDCGASAEQEESAAGHGLMRWQQGYHLREVTREWGHLNLCVLDELDRYASARVDLEQEVMSRARRVWAEQYGQGLSVSTAHYFALQEIEATGHVRDLEQAIGHLQEMERQRAELLRQATHDLRGHVGIVKNATTGLARGALPEATRDKLLQLLQSGVSSLHAMLDDVMNLARLQAGHEVLVVRSFDVSKILHALCERMRPFAADRALWLRAEGPATLPVDGDEMKTQRIAQNLLLNALKYTHEGGVTVSWGDSRDNDPERWMLCVQDTGPGFHAGPGAPLAGALRKATSEAREIEKSAGKGTHWHTGAQGAGASSATPDTRPVHQERGEGVGLSIVRRLCEMLDASMELESRVDEGTVFRVLFPRRYGAAAKSE